MLALLFVMLSALPAAASENYHMVPVSLEERIKAADIIVEGEVVAQRSFWDTRQENIYTVNTIRLYKVFKGEAREKQVEIVTEGGTVGLVKHVVSSALQLHSGQQGMFFLNRGSRPGIATQVLTPYASRQGFVRYDTDRATAADPFNAYTTVQEVYRAVTARTGHNYNTVTENTTLETGELRQSRLQQAQAATLAPVITSFSPERTSAGTGAVLTITGTGFGSTQGNGFVEFRNADDGGSSNVRPFITDYISWTNTQIRVRVPSVTPTGGTAGSGRIRVTANDGTSTTSTNSLVIEFAYSNVVAEKGITPVQPVLINADRNGGYTIQFAPSMHSRAAAQEGFRRAMNSWVCTTNINWKIGTPSTSETVADDGRSVVRFASGSETGAQVLARTISRYRGCAIERNGVADTIFWLTEFDMEINNNFRWQFGPGGPGNADFDFETIVLHELGHAHQLGHVLQENTLMYYNIRAGRLIRDLTPPDIAGATLVINRSLIPPPCGGRSPMLLKTDGDCNLAPEIFTFDATANTAGTVNVIWTTNEERNVRHYVVQRSQDGETWEDIGQVNAKGPGNYTFTDNNQLPRRSYYRLRVVYTDGTEAFSARVQVLNPEDLRSFKVFPNPIGLNTSAGGAAREVLQIEYLVRTNTDLSLKLYDIQGRLVRDLEVTLTDGTDVIEINVSDLAAGTYLLRWTEGVSSGVVKVVKL